MSDSRRVCAACQAPLAPGVSFCESCGAPVAAPRAARAAQKSGGGALGRIALGLVGLLLILAGLRGPLLGAVGESTTGTVVDVRQDRTNSKTTDHNHVVRYEFRTASGASETGSYTLYRVYDTLTLPRRGSSVPVRYLPAWPALNVAGAEAEPNLTGLGMAALGVALVVVSTRFR